MPARLGKISRWLGSAVAGALVVAAILWNAWTFSQYSAAKRQLDALQLEAIAAPVEPPALDPAAAAELELLRDADRRGILEENFLALLSDRQKRALAEGRRARIADWARARTTSLIFGALLILGGAGFYFVGRTLRRKAR